MTLQTLARSEKASGRVKPLSPLSGEEHLGAIDQGPALCGEQDGRLTTANSYRRACYVGWYVPKFHWLPSRSRTAKSREPYSWSVNSTVTSAPAALARAYSASGSAATARLATWL